MKRRLAPRLLGVEGVTGVGVREGCLVVYLDSRREATLRRVAALIEAESPRTPFECVVTGPFRRTT